MHLADSPGWGADEAVTVLYGAYYCALTQLATLLVGDVAMAEEIVQDAFVGMHGAWRQLGDRDKALTYLQRAVVCGSRSRRPVITRPAAPQPEPHLVTALRGLPARQREALVLRYYGDLAEIQIASAMGVSANAVTSHLSRGMFSLQDVLGGEHPA